MNTANLPSTLLEAVRFFGSEENCHDLVVSMRWPDGIRCAHCDSERAGAMVTASYPSRGKNPNAKPTCRRLWNCKACKKQFTVKTGTIFESSPIALEKWLPAVWMICNAKNGVSSYEIARSLGVCQKTSWFMMHRIRLAMREGSFEVSGEAEADEAYIGGKIGNLTVAQKQKKYGHRKPTGHSAKQPVLGILQRSPFGGGSKVILEQVDHASAKEMGPHLLEHIKPGTWLYTDSHAAYKQFSTHYIHA